MKPRISLFLIEKCTFVYMIANTTEMKLNLSVKLSGFIIKRDKPAKQTTLRLSALIPVSLYKTQIINMI